MFGWGTNTGTWINLPAGFPLQFDSTLMTFTLISNAANQVTTLGAVSVQLIIGLANFNSPKLIDAFSFTITTGDDVIDPCKKTTINLEDKSIP
jgi:hypothetical protein